MELECGYSPQDKTNRNLIFFGSPLPALALAMAAVGKSTLGRALQWDALRSSPILQTSADYTYTHIHTYWLQTITHTHTYLPTPDPSPPSLWTASLTSGSGPALILAAGPDGWLLPLLQSRVSMVYYVLLLLRCFSCSHTVLPKEHSLGVIFFSRHIPHVMLCCIFLQFPVFLSCLPPCHICCVCMDRLMANFAGTCD